MWAVAVGRVGVVSGTFLEGNFNIDEYVYLGMYSVTNCSTIIPVSYTKITSKNTTFNLVILLYIYWFHQPFHKVP